MRTIEGIVVPTIVTLLLHLAVLLLLSANWSSTTFKVHEIRQIKSIQAKMVALPPRAEEQPKPKPVEKPQPVDKPKPVQKAPPLATDTAPKPALKPKVPVEPQPEPDMEALRKAREKAEEIRRQQAVQQEMMAEALAEEQFEQAEEDAEVAESYIALLKRVIENNWSRPASARNGMQAELLIQLVPTGEIVSVNVVQSSGNAAFDRSAENAVKKIGSFTELQGMPGAVFERYFRKLRFRFKPEDLRS